MLAALAGSCSVASPAAAAGGAVVPLAISYDLAEPDAPEVVPVPDEAPEAPSPPADAERYDSFGERVGAIKWEFGALLAGYSVVHVGTALKNPQPFRFQVEGFFGRNTNNLGLDKLAHGFNTYVFSDLLYHRIARKAGGGLPSALTAATLAVGLQTLGEVTDGFHERSGFSVNDMAFNVAGGGFSVLRNSVPGLKEKLDFRLSVIPNRHVYSFKGKPHYEQQRYLFALKLAGFERLERTPLRLIELHLGYYGKDFLREDRAAGVIPQRKVFAGFGINFGELLFRNSRSTAGRAARSVLHYIQPPYTTLRVK
jgi:hypothetical protein